MGAGLRMEMTRQAWLLEVKGSSPGRRAMLPLEGELLIGRAPGSGLVVSGDGCGWRHCTIEGEEGGYRLRDFKSPGGTFLNGRHVLESVLTNGDQISIGASRFEIGRAHV